MAELPPFKLERFFALHEFSAPYQACNSDVEALTMKELLAMADAIIFATASRHEAELVTGDADFDGLPRVTLIR